MIIEKIQADLRQALKAKEEIRVSTLRLLLAEVHNREIQKQAKLKDEDVVAVIRQQLKLRQEAIEAYQKGNRDDLVKKEQKELEILSKYLPQKISPEELEKIIRQTISEVGAGGQEDFGKVMGAVMVKIKGRAEGKEVAEIVKKLI